MEPSVHSHSVARCARLLHRRLRLILALNLLVGVALISSQAVGRPLARIDFKYGSNQQLPPEMRLIELSKDVDTVSRLLKSTLKAEGATLLDEHTGGGLIVTMTPASRSCWEANGAIHRAEWSAFSLNNFKMYKQIDRSAACDEAVATAAPADVPSRLLKFDFPPVLAEVTTTRRVVDSLGIDGGYTSGDSMSDTAVESLISLIGGVQVGTSTETLNYRAEFGSRIYFSIWSTGGKTTVYAWAVPTNSGIEAAPGNSIGQLWYNDIRGEREAKIVRHYIEWLEELKEKKIL